MKAALRKGMGRLPPVQGNENSAMAAATPVLQEPTRNHKARQTDNLDSSNHENGGDKHDATTNSNHHHEVADTKTQLSDKKQEAQAQAETEIPNVQSSNCTNQLSCADLKPY